jgi:hypothetical protein
MTTEYILEQPIEALLSEIGDNDITRLYNESEDIFNQMVLHYGDSPEELFEQVISYFQLITGKNFDKNRLSSITTYIRECIDDSSIDDCPNCLLDRFIRIILIACYEHK